MDRDTNKGRVYFLIIIGVVYFSNSILVYSDPNCDKYNPVIFNFGDSISDGGGYVAATGRQLLHPYGRTFFHQPAGRACDGRTVIDFLCESLNTSFLRPYLQSLGVLNYTNGANFAISGASILPQDQLINLNVQIHQFLYFKSLSLQLTAQGFKNYVEEEGFNNALYIVDIGGNDLLDAFDDLPYGEAVEWVPYLVAQIKNAILNLYENGGRKFWIHNSHPLGCLPSQLATLGYNASDLDQYGCLTTLNEYITFYNEELSSICEELRSELENATIVYVNIYAIRFDLIANSTSYGFASPVLACCGFGGPPYNYNSSIGCGELGYNVCEQGSLYVNWDGIHYTDAANNLTASKILTANYNTPPLNLDFFVTSACNNNELKTNIILDSSNQKS